MVGTVLLQIQVRDPVSFHPMIPSSSIHPQMTHNTALNFVSPFYISKMRRSNVYSLHMGDWKTQSSFSMGEKWGWRISFLQTICKITILIIYMLLSFLDNSALQCPWSSRTFKEIQAIQEHWPLCFLRYIEGGW